MSRMVGTVSRGIRTPIIRSGDDLVEIVTSSLLEAAKEDGFALRDRDIVAMTEAIVARAQGNYATVDDIIIREAFAKMETDPAWEKTVINKVKEYYTGDRAAGSMRNGYRTLTGQNILQNYMMQNLIGGLGFGNSVSSFYGNSVFGDWTL